MDFEEHSSFFLRPFTFYCSRWRRVIIDGARHYFVRGAAYILQGPLKDPLTSFRLRGTLFMLRFLVVDVRPTFLF